MVNQIQNYSIANKMPSAYSVFQRDNNSKTDSVTVPKPNFTDENKESKHTHNLGVKLATTSLIAGFAVLLLAKGLPKNFYKKIDTFFKGKIDKIYQREKIEDGMNRLDTKRHLTLRFIKSFMEKSQALFNIGVIKDAFLLKTVEKTKIFKRPNAWFTKQFEKIASAKVRRNYEGTFHEIENAVAKYKKLNKTILGDNPEQKITIERVINGKLKKETKTAQEWVNELETRTKNIQRHYFEDFLQFARESRLEETKEKLSPLNQRVWDIVLDKESGKFKNKKLYSTFLSEDISAESKIELANKVNECKKVISSDIRDTYIATQKLLSNIETAPDDIATRKIIKSLKSTLLEYRNLSGADEIAKREEITNTLKMQLKTLTESIDKYDYSSEFKSQTQKYVEDLSEILKNNKKGEFQEVLTIYKQLLQPEEYKTVKKSTYKAINSLDKSINLETEKLYEKLRDFAIGSVPADMLSILASTGFVGVGLAKANNSDERTSVALKYGIPVIGAVATSVLCTAGLVSGGTAIILGLISGEVINKIGTFTDNKIKEIKKKNISLSDINNYIQSKTAEKVNDVKQANTDKSV